MKKLFLSLLAAALCFSATACHQNIIIKDTTEITLETGEELPESGILTDGSRLGILQKIEDEAGESVKGVILTTGSGQHDYPAAEILSREGYKTSELCYEYELNEWIDFYAQTVPSDLQMNIYILKNEENVDYGELTAAQIEDRCFSKGRICWAVRPDPENYGYLDSVCIKPDEAVAGLYNVFFSAPGVRYMVQLSLIDPQ